MAEYNFKEIEKKWQSFWEKEGIFSVDTKEHNRSKYYCLVMFPYPSSELHVGHGRNYIIGDAVVRYQKMKGFSVLSPMGWDAFGLPAENQAIKRKIHPKEWTLRNIARIKEQLGSWGVGYDWRREITTCLPDYYKWTQWLFLKLYENGLAYRKKAQVNYCPSCQTVLANEQVIEGKCERCSTQVEQKDLEQWFFKITAYADRLLDDLALLRNWPERVKTMQKNWIGRSEGVEIDFPLAGTKEKIKCFTTRVDTIFGATFLAVSYEHPLIETLIKDADNRQAIEEFIQRAKSQPKSARLLDSFEKEGVFCGKYAVNPMTGEEIPIWIANYILAEYGTGAIMCVPAHDGRDWEFAQKYDLEIKKVIAPPDKREMPEDVFEAEGILVNSGQFSGLPSQRAKEEIAEFMEKEGIGKRKVNYRLRDWLISRQRYWGAPIPIIYCPQCGIVPVDEEDLPVLLPENVEFLPSGQSPLNFAPDFLNTTCPRCGSSARRETDTMDTFVDSSWYYLRYISPRRDDVPFASDEVNHWLPVDQYIGGVEHAILHLMYSRFINKFLYDLKMVNFKEPFYNLFTQGMIVKDGFKMSKSKGNVVAPDYIVEKYGADTMRLYILFMGPPEKDAEWKDEGLLGCFRFLKRCWRLLDMKDELDWQNSKNDENQSQSLRRKVHAAIKEVTHDLEASFQFNTAIAMIMELVNEIYKGINQNIPLVKKEVFLEAVKTLFLLLAPFTPHMCEEAWQKLGEKPSIFSALWPSYDEKALVQKEINIAVIVNGKVREHLEITAEMKKEEIEEKALALPKIKEILGGNKPKKTIYVAGRLLNIVS